jgi:hypothetical protein
LNSLRTLSLSFLPTLPSSTGVTKAGEDTSAGRCFPE